ncbi:hypothetical protein [Streptomyces sp. NBC_01353]|uniref:hypothetical protein n=1 Tax=Streptomyces sp. NBC_01353 TaxID=2903835 RepID=UPI002E32654D|nr:hypothetical protein [Streptomyces sp. NBC_01353]
MHRNDNPDRAGAGELTTEDIARSRDQGAEDRQDAGPPMYPGEATPTADQTAALPPEESDSVEDSTTNGSERAAEEPVTARNQSDEDQDQALLSAQDVDAYRSRWQQIQNDFVDDPEQAVQAADGLVADVMRTLAEKFAGHKNALEGQWNQGEAVDTESLRMALREYRSFFNRLLTK